MTDLLTDTENMIAFHIPVNFQHFPFYPGTQSHPECGRIGVWLGKGAARVGVIAQMNFNK